MKGKGKGSGWHGDSRRHGMARKGIRTAKGIQGVTMKEKWANKIDFFDEFEKGNIMVWDNGGRTADRYTVLIDRQYVFGMSERPFHPQGFNVYAGDVERWSMLSTTPYKNVDEWIEMTDKDDKRVSAKDVPSVIKEAIMNRMAGDD